jgi:hypothetical protein
VPVMNGMIIRPARASDLGSLLQLFPVRRKDGGGAGKRKTTAPPRPAKPLRREPARRERYLGNCAPGTGQGMTEGYIPKTCCGGGALQVRVLRWISTAPQSDGRDTGT